MDMDPRTVLHFLKEVKEQRELTAEEVQLGKIAAKIFGKQVHEEALAAKASYDNAEIKRLKARGYSEREAREAITTEDYNARITRGFGVSKRCRIGAPNCTTQHSHSDFLPLEYTPAYQLLGLA